MLNLNEQLGLGESAVRNIGYVAFKRIYKELRLDEFWRRQTRGLKIEYDMEKIFYLLVISRLMDPGSKRYTFANKDQYFEPLEGIELEQIYKAMDLIAVIPKSVIMTGPTITLISLILILMKLMMKEISLIKS